MRLGIVATHPIQYYAPLYRALAASGHVDLTVCFAHRPTAAEQGAGFGVPFTWDVDVLAGYASQFLPNVSRAAAQGAVSGHFADYDTPRVAEMIRGGQFDAVLVQGWNARCYWQAMRACWNAGTPVFVRGDSQLSDDVWVKRWAKCVVYPRFVRRFAACLSVGVRSDAYFAYYGARRIVRSPHSVDNEMFAVQAAKARAQVDSLRRAWGLMPGRAVVLFAGKLVARKRPLDLVAALKHVPDAQIVFAGDGPLRAACGRAARAAGVPAAFIGFQNQQNMPRVYAAADLLVLPSGRKETWGLVVNEAMASGLPVVVSNSVGCVPDLVEDGATGFTYAVGDAWALAEKIRLLAANPELRYQLSAAAKDRIANFSPERAAAGILEAIGV